MSILLGKEGYGTDEQFPPVTITDSVGYEITEGCYVQCIIDKHSWLKKGELVVITGAQKTKRSDGTGWSLNYTDLNGAQSGIGSHQVVRVDLTPREKADCELQRYYKELARAVDRLVAAHGEKARLETIIRQIESAHNG